MSELQIHVRLPLLMAPGMGPCADQLVPVTVNAGGDVAAAVLSSLVEAGRLPAAACAANWALYDGFRRFRWQSSSDCLDASASVPRTLELRVAGGLRGGKGGFGALLRNSGKGRQGRITDFGACRDLQGRRLRHLNQEARLSTWNSEAEKARRKQEGGAYKEALGEHSGLPGWHLAVPSWAEGFGPKAAKKAMSAELRRRRGIEREQAEQEAEKEAKRARDEAERRRYAFIPDRSELGRDALLSGLRKAAEASGPDAGTPGASGSLPLLPMEWGSWADTAPTAPTAAATAAAAGAAGAAGASAPAEAAAPAALWSGVTVLSAGGDDDVLDATPPDADPGCMHLQCRAPFGSIGLLGLSMRSGRWQFEVELLTGGLCQVGWAGPEFERQMAGQPALVASAAAAAEGLNGAGDLAGSWAWDGSRSAAFAGGEQLPGKAGPAWQKGAVVRCSVDCERGTLDWTVDGTPVSLNTAGKRRSRQQRQEPDGDETPLVSSATPAAAGGYLFPCLSLEQGEEVVIRLLPPAGAAEEEEGACRWAGLAAGGLGMQPTAAAAAPAAAAAAAATAPEQPGAAGTQEMALQEEAEEAPAAKRTRKEPVPKEPAQPKAAEPVDEKEAAEAFVREPLCSFATAEALAARGPAWVAAQLGFRGLKRGGRPAARVERLWAARSAYAGSAGGAEAEEEDAVLPARLLSKEGKAARQAAGN